MPLSEPAHGRPRFRCYEPGNALWPPICFADADLSKHCAATRVTPYPEGFVDWLARTPCERWLYTGALENYPETVDALAALRPLQGHNAKVLRRVRDPMQLQAALCGAGFAFPETKLEAEIAVDPKDEAWIGKTYRGSSGSGVGVASGATYQQRRVEGVPLSAVYLGEQFLGVTRQLCGRVVGRCWHVSVLRIDWPLAVAGEKRAANSGNREGVEC